jgi:hypothetical protein
MPEFPRENKPLARSVSRTFLGSPIEHATCQRDALANRAKALKRGVSW